MKPLAVGVSLALAVVALDARPDLQMTTEMTMVSLINNARSQARMCGDTQFPAVPALHFNSRVAKAAAVQAKDMASHGALSHSGSNGSTADSRLQAMGYKADLVLELIGGGFTKPADMLKQWLADGPHCAVVMDSRMVDVGAGFAENPSSMLKHYWTVDFAKPK